MACPAAVLGARRRSRAILSHGGMAPIPPLYYNERIVREESVCGGQRLCEHVLPGKIADNIARRAGRFRCPIIRVWKTPIPLIYNSRVVRKEGSFSGQRMGVCLLPGKSLSGARTGLTDSAVSAFGCSAAVLFYQSGTARRSAPPPFSPSSQQWGMGRKPHSNGRAEKSASSVRGVVS